jgi:transposase
VRIALRSGQPRRQAATYLGVGFSTLAKWIQRSRPDDLPAVADIDLAKENERLCMENRVLREPKAVMAPPGRSLQSKSREGSGLSKSGNMFGQ